ncbi:MAG: hypothetical protein BKPUNTRY_001080, partial [Candidatus Fervidibacter sp.]
PAAVQEAGTTAESPAGDARQASDSCETGSAC